MMPNSQISGYGKTGAVVVRSIDPTTVDETAVRLDYLLDERLTEPEQCAVRSAVSEASPAGPGRTVGARP